MELDPTLRFQSHLIRLGATALVFSIVPALLGAFDLTASAEIAIATHVTMLIIGVLLLCIGLAWSSLKLTTKLVHFSYWAIVVGGLVVFVVGTLAAIKGVGGRTLSAFDADAMGSALAEDGVRVALVVAGVLLMGGLLRIGWYVWSEEEQPSQPAPLPWRVRIATNFFGGLNVWLRNDGRGLFRWGLLLMWGGIFLATVVTGVFGLPFLSVVTYATIGITALIFMAVGLVWGIVEKNLAKRVQRANRRVAEAEQDPDVSEAKRAQLRRDAAREENNSDSVPKIVRWGLFSGLVLNLGAGLLAFLDPSLHADPLAAVSAGLMAVGGYARLVKVVALLALFANSVGIIAFAHGIYDRASNEPEAWTMEERQADRLLRFGSLALVVGFLTAWLPELSRLPRLGVGTYATLLIIGPMFLCFSLVWKQDAQSKEPDKERRIQLTHRQQKFVVSVVSFGALSIVVAGMVLALLGVGGGTLAVAAAGAVGSERAELLAKIAIDVAILTTGIGMIYFWVGIRPPSRTLFHRIAWVLSLGIVAFCLQAMFYHSVVNRRLAGSYPIRLPDYTYGTTSSVLDTVVWDDSTHMRAQNWTHDDRQWFSHASQGGAFEVPIAYDWIMNLEQPTVALLPNLEVGKLMDPAYLEQFGFIPDPDTAFDSNGLSINRGYIARYLARFDPAGQVPTERGVVENNPRQLPVGFTRTDNWVDHSTDQMTDVLGFTCAACHTSQIDYVDKERNRLVRVRIEGGPANIDLGKFRRAVSVSLYLTQLLPGRFDRFAERLGVARGADRTKFKEDFDALIDRLREVSIRQRDLAIYPTEEGFGRLDAMGRIFNFVFGSDLGDERNLGIADAPVNFPHLWDAARFDWVQYNASFQQPMIRNAGQSMGVFASVDLEGAGEAVDVAKDPALFASSVNVLNVHEMELLLGGCTLNSGYEPALLEDGCGGRSFEGLRSPRWPELFGLPDPELEERGRDLYGQHCARCHLPDPRDSSFDAQAWTKPDSLGNRFLALRVDTLNEVGTDLRSAINFATRSIDLDALGRRLGINTDSVPAGEELPALLDSVLSRGYRDLGERLDAQPEGFRAANALLIVVDSVLNRRYADYKIEERLRPTLNGQREAKMRIVIGYRARPLNGVWATAPFLHNGSVPTLYHLLSPQSERPDTFHLGSRRFDPKLVGFEYKRHDPGYFEFDTSLPGNSNAGHSFEGDPVAWRGGPGVLGPEFTPEDRMAIIEYLKGIPPLPVRPAVEVGGDG